MKWGTSTQVVGGAKGGWGPWESCESRSRQQEAEAALAKHLAQAMQFLRLEASPRYISKLNTGGRKASLKADVYGRWQFANISILDKPELVTQRCVAKLEESAANMYFIRACPISIGPLTVLGEQATMGLILLLTHRQFMWISPECPNKYVKKNKTRI